MSSSLDGDGRSSLDGDRHSSMDGDRRSSSDGDRRSSLDGDRRSSLDEDRRSSSDGDRCSSLDGDRRSPLDGDRRSSPDEDRRSPLDEDRCSSLDGDRRSSPDGDRRSSLDGDRRSPLDGDRRSSLASDGSGLCWVCSCPSPQHMSYGGMVCLSCRQFFIRAKGRKYKCSRGSGRCPVNQLTRINCKLCRYNKCLYVGMDPNLVENGKRKKGKQQKENNATDIQEDVKESKLESSDQILLEPQIKFTLEEEFRLADFLVKRDYINELSFISLYSIHPREMDAWVRSLPMDLQGNRIHGINERLRQTWLHCNLVTMLDNVRNVYSEFGLVDKLVAEAVLVATKSSMEALYYGFRDRNHPNNNCQSFVEQEKFLGTWTRARERWMIETAPDVLNIRGVGREDLDLFSSPWAVTQQDEEYVEDVYGELVEVIGDDKKLSTIFSLLLMISPQEGSVGESVARNQQIIKLQTDLRQFMYRYVTSQEEKSCVPHWLRISRLEGLIHKLHNAGQINSNKRIVLDTF